ncbi:MAG TPA: hypothetical protein VGO11_08450 [Chthoniobacteraceae bacterium]|nr:hypothetical protein [Chthoniobacteraceae bacterium]
MSIDPLTEIEQHRLELLRDFQDGGEAASDFAPGSFGCHELLDRTALMMHVLEEQVAEHQACVQRPDWFSLAYRAVELLNQLYQEVGAEHLAELPSTIPTTPTGTPS